MTRSIYIRVGDVDEELDHFTERFFDALEIRRSQKRENFLGEYMVGMAAGMKFTVAASGLVELQFEIEISSQNTLAHFRPDILDGYVEVLAQYLASKGFGVGLALHVDQMPKGRKPRK